MKRYKVKYFLGDRSSPSSIIELSKSEKKDGVRILLLFGGKKTSQSKYKNDLLNGFYILYWHSSANYTLRNWKKDKMQGINIYFKK